MTKKWSRPTTPLAFVAIAVAVSAAAVVVVVPRPCRAWSSSPPPAQRLRQRRAFAPATTATTATTTDLRQSKNGNDDDDVDDDNGNNVVFRPSPDPDAFDSRKIGSARVHRYSEPGSDAAYVMWYHGRDATLDDDDDGDGGKAVLPPPLPPLSTGRIGRATSRNGLAWRRDDEGSADSERDGTCLGLNAESWYGFDTSHVGLGQVMIPMTTPTIRSEGGVYVMYYMGGNFEHTDLVSYLPKRWEEEVGEEEDEGERPGGGGLIPRDAKLRGMKMRIGAAISQDGITWGRVEGDDPSGACMVPFDRGDINNVDVSVAKDEKTGRPYHVDEELYCGWPEVIVNPVGPNENNKKGSGASTDPDRINFYMYYSTMFKESKEKAIAVAVSNNGFAFSKAGAVRFVDGDDDADAALDGGGRARCNVVRRATLSENDTGLWEEGASWMMFYEGVSIEDGRHRILAAESDDLRTWRRVGLALDVGRSRRTGGGGDGGDDDGGGGGGEEDAWDSRGVGSPHVIRLDDGYFRMYYTGEGADGRTAIGVARSADMRVWERERVVELSSLLNR